MAKTVNLSDSFNDDCFALLDDGFKITDGEAITTLLLLKEDQNPLKRLEGFESLVDQFLPVLPTQGIEKSLFNSMMASVTDLLIFREISEGTATLQSITEWLKMCIAIYEKLQCVLDFLLTKKLSLGEAKSVPLSIFRILLITLRHCKEQKYRELNEIVLLFQSAQGLHSKLLKLLESCVKLEDELNIFINILENLGEIGEVLMDMNIISLVDNWKGYIALVQNLSAGLNRTSFDVGKPLGYFALQITWNLNNVFKIANNKQLNGADLNDEKAVNQNLKLCNFLLRIAVKLCEVFWCSLERIAVSIIHFLSSMYSFYPAYLKAKNYTVNFIEIIDAPFFTYINELMDKLIKEEVFLKAFSMLEIKTSEPGFLFFCSAILQKLSKHSSQNAVTIIEVFFTVLSQNYGELFLPIKIQENNVNHSLYDDAVLNTVIIISQLNHKDINNVELLLLKYILQESIWTALFASDVWITILRQKSSGACFEMLSYYLIKYEELFQSKVQRPEQAYMENFLMRLYGILSDDYRIKLMEKFPLEICVTKWKILSLRNFPKNCQFQIEVFLINFMEKLESLVAGKRMTLDDFHFLCDGFEVVSTLPDDSGINISHLLKLIVKTWNYEFNDNYFSNTFMGKLIRATKNFVLLFDNQQLLLLLKNIQKYFPLNPNIKIQALNTLYALANKSFKPSQEKNQIFQILSEIFRTSLEDKNPIVKQKAIETFFAFLHSTAHQEILQNALMNRDDLQALMSNFLKKHIVEKINAEEYFAQQSLNKFCHRCPEVAVTIHDDNLAQARKKFKIDREEIDVVMARIKTDVELLHRLKGKERELEGNFVELVSLLSKQIDYKI